jgi:hypothetical protein
VAASLSLSLSLSLVNVLLLCRTLSPYEILILQSILTREVIQSFLYPDYMVLEVLRVFVVFVVTWFFIQSLNGCYVDVYGNTLYMNTFRLSDDFHLPWFTTLFS